MAVGNIDDDGGGLFEIFTRKSHQDLFQVWKVYTKAKLLFCDGPRLENISWRMWNMQNQQQNQRLQQLQQQQSHKRQFFLETTNETSNVNDSDNFVSESIVKDKNEQKLLKSLFDSEKILGVAQLFPEPRTKKKNLAHVTTTSECTSFSLNTVICSNCGTNNTPLWRQIESINLCNACGLHFKLKGSHRPISRSTNHVIKKRNRISKKKLEKSMDYHCNTKLIGPIATISPMSSISQPMSSIEPIANEEKTTSPTTNSYDLSNSKLFNCFLNGNGGDCSSDDNQSLFSICPSQLHS